jgi:hypothetical protein
VFSNLDGLFAFHASAEDARYLVPELGEEVDIADLVALGEHQCYVRLSAGGARLPTFSVRLDSPPSSDPALAERLASASATRYGRDRSLVERDLRSALARIDAARGAWGEGTQTTQSQKGTPTAGSKKPKEGRARNEHRNLPEARQTQLPGIGADGHEADDDAHLLDEGETTGEEGVA